MADARQPFMEVTLEGGKPFSSGVESVMVEDHDRLADKATVVLNDTAGVTSEAIASGREIKVAMGWKGENAVLFEGVIQRPKPETGAGSRRLTIVAYDLSTLMNVAANPTRHTGGSLKAVLSAILEKYPRIRAGKIEPDPDPQYAENDPNLIQPSLTDLQFIQTLAVRYRARAFVEYCRGAKNNEDEASYFFFVPEAKIAAQKAEATLRCCSGFHELIQFKMDQVMTSAAPYRPSAVIDPVNGTPATEDPLADPAKPPPPPDPEREQAADALGAGDTLRAAGEAAAKAKIKPEALIPTVRAAGLPSDPAFATAISQRDPTTVRGLRGRGVAVGNIHLRAKSKVTIKGITSYGEGDWYVRVAKHKVENGSYTTELVVTQ